MLVQEFDGRKKRELIVILKRICSPQIHAQFSFLINKLIGFHQKRPKQFHRNFEFQENLIQFSTQFQHLPNLAEPYEYIHFLYQENQKKNFTFLIKLEIY